MCFDTRTVSPGLMSGWSFFTRRLKDALMSSFVAVGDTLSTAYKSPAAAPPRPPPLDMVLSFTNSSKRLSTCQRHLAGLLD